MTTITGDRYFRRYTIFDTPIPYEQFTVNARSEYLVIQMTIEFRYETYVRQFKSIMLEEYVVKTMCSQSLYGKTCWYQCIDSIRKLCYCLYQATYLNIQCEHKCNEGIEFLIFQIFILF